MKKRNVRRPPVISGAEAAGAPDPSTGESIDAATDRLVSRALARHPDLFDQMSRVEIAKRLQDGRLVVPDVDPSTIVIHPRGSRRRKET